MFNLLQASEQDDISYTWEHINEGSVKGISRIYEAETKHTVIQLSADIHHNEFTQVLRFLYTGTLLPPAKFSDNGGRY